MLTDGGKKLKKATCIGEFEISKFVQEKFVKEIYFFIFLSEGDKF